MARCLEISVHTLCPMFVPTGDPERLRTKVQENLFPQLPNYSLAQSLELPILPELVQNTIKGEACRGILHQNRPDPPNQLAGRGANRRRPNLAGTACRG